MWYSANNKLPDYLDPVVFEADDGRGIKRYVGVCWGGVVWTSCTYEHPTHIIRWKYIDNEYDKQTFCNCFNNLNPDDFHWRV